MGFTDIHHHLLYGLDDGARSYDEMCAMLAGAAEEGISRIVATPHVTPGVYPFDREQFDRSLGEAREHCAREALGIELFEGSEILYTEQTCRFLEERQVPTLAGGEHVLVEFSPDVRWERLHGALASLRRAGFLTIVAHAERYECLVRHPARLEELREELEVCFQVNCASFLRSKGFLVNRFLKRMLERNLLDCVATDAHRADGARTVNMRAAYAALAERIGEARARSCADGSVLFGSEGGGGS